MRTVRWLGVVLALAGCGPMPPRPTAKADFFEALAPVFQVDMPASLARLAALPESGLDEKQRRTRDCMQARFGGGAFEPGDASLQPAGAAVLKAYRRYWTALLMKQSTPEEAEAALSEALAPWAAPASQDLAARAEDAARRLESQGLFVLSGITPPLRELMLWRRQTPLVETIALPGGPIDVRVTLLDDFVSLGWSAWGTCERAHTGGWTTDKGIMVVTPSWKLDSEDYRVSLLAHEAQHFSDYRRYPKLSSPDLEYRAKLVELALADETQGDLLRKFSSESHRDRALPHPFASYWVIERMRDRLGSDRWNDFSRPLVRQAALAELAADDAALDAQGRVSVVTALPD